MKFTNEQVGELVDRFSECLKARKKLRRGTAVDDYYNRQDVYDAALTALTRELNAVLPSEFTLFERDQIAMLEAQERANKPESMADRMRRKGTWQGPPKKDQP